MVETMRWNEARGQLVIVSNHASPRINSYVKNFAVTTSEEQLQELFLRFGAIKNISVKPDRGFAFVDFQDPDSVQQVLTATPETFWSTANAWLLRSDSREVSACALLSASRVVRRKASVRTS